MAVPDVQFNHNGTIANVLIRPPVGTRTVNQVTFTIDIPALPAAPVPPPVAAPAPRPSPSLVSRVARGLYNHSGKIAFIASGLMIASQTQAGAKAFADFGTFAANNYDSIRNTVGTATTAALKFGKDNLKEINAAVSAIWAIPRAVRAGSKKMSAFWLAAGAASAAAPYALTTGSALNEACGKVAAFVSSTLAQFNGTKQKDL